MSVQKNSLRTACIILLFAGAAVSLIPVIPNIEYVPDNKLLFSVCFVYAAAFLLGGFALALGKYDLLKAAAAITIVGLILKTALPLRWMVSNVYYTVNNFIYLAIMLAGAVGSILLTVLFFGGYKGPRKLITGILIASVIAETIYVIESCVDLEYAFFEYIFDSTAGIVFMSFVGVIGMSLLPLLVAEGKEAVVDGELQTYRAPEPVVSTAFGAVPDPDTIILPVMDETLQSGEDEITRTIELPDAPDDDEATVGEAEIIALLEKYKELLDKGVITQSEFEEKKRKLL